MDSDHQKADFGSFLDIIEHFSAFLAAENQFFRILIEMETRRPRRVQFRSGTGRIATRADEWPQRAHRTQKGNFNAKGARYTKVRKKKIFNNEKDEIHEKDLK